MEENGVQALEIQTEENQKEVKDVNGEETVTEAEISREEELDGGEINEKKPKGRGRGRTKKLGTEEQVNEKELEEKKRQKKEPATPIIDRPARERKSIDRFAASVEKEKVKEFKIEKGLGTTLKDIPNIVYKLSKRKGSDDSVQLLHKLLYGKRVKPHHAKQNILQFSGYVWVINQEKEKAKAKERLEKCVKESLLQISDLLDLNLPKSASKKEDVVVKLLEFLESPHKTTDILIEEKEQKSKGKKRKKTSSTGTRKKSLGKTPKKRRKREGNSAKEEPDTVEEEEEDVGGDESAEDVDEEPEDEEEPEEEEPVRKRRGSKNSDDDDYDVKFKKPKKKGRKSSKKQSDQEIEVEEDDSKDTEEAASEDVKVKSSNKVPAKRASKPGKASVQSPSKEAKKSDTASSKVFSRKKKKEDEQEEDLPKKEKPSKGRGAGRPNAREESKSKQKTKRNDPSDEELRGAICDLLKDADFSTVTFTDVVKQLEEKFSVDLSEKKGHVKILIREEISKIADEDEGEGEGEGEDDNGVDEDTERDKEESDPGDVADQAAED